MREHRIDAYLVTGADPHLSEYLPDHWQTREWITGFTGSYGRVVITMEQVLLWTDTRYFLQAGEELAGTGIVVMKERVPDAISVEEWICSHLKQGEKFAVDGRTISAADANEIEAKIGAKGICFDTQSDLVSPCWEGRPQPSMQQVYEHPQIFAGKSRVEKIGEVRKRLSQSGKDALIISMLDDLAWILNLRGGDIDYIPLFTAYGYLDQHRFCLFVDPLKTENIREILKKDGIQLFSYDSFENFLQRIKSLKWAIDPVRTNSLIAKILSENNSVTFSTSLIALMKSIKDEREIEGMKQAHLRDGAAMVNFLHWLTQAINKERLSEISVGDKVAQFRSQQPHFKGPSFHPIVGFGDHGAIVHYHARPATDYTISADNLLLIDSGGQYWDGTTDITRTVSPGIPSEKQREDFTTCLKGHIALATIVFPEGTRGYSLDPLVRKPLWDRGINYGHGTGHGIGYFLSVHEGPMSIRTEYNSEPIREGQIMSNEPGIYRENEYGIRIENVILCKNYRKSEYGTYLCFETISLCPLDRKLIKVELLSQDEIIWINNYHATVFKKVSPLLENPGVVQWLKQECAPIG